MRLSKLLKLNKSQFELDFVDIDPGKDTPLFVDPYFLAQRTDPWSVSATRTIQSFFEFFITLIRSNQIDDARDLFDHLHEPNETRLGMSKGRPRGNGVGEDDADRIFQSLLESRAVQTGLLEDLEDCRLFVDGIDKDKTSDMATNIIRGHLLKYTLHQCALWGIPAQSGVPSGFVWDREARRWVNFHADALIVQGTRLLLVPKAIVSYSKRYTAQRYHRHFVLSFLQHEHLKLGTSLVRRVKRRDGSIREYVAKKDLAAGPARFSKDFLARFTQAHPEVFARFKAKAGVGEESITGEELAPGELDPIVDRLMLALRDIPAGKEHATRYHRTVVGILELLFYPDLTAPQIEQEIHDGRKRIDLTFDNAARGGFFFNLHMVRKIPCPFIMVECKNYSRDVSNPELDQMAGRFGTNRGQFGLVVCRSIEDMPLFLSRCRDTYRDGRGAILPLVDDDLLDLLAQLKASENLRVQTLLDDRFREIAMG